MPDVLHSETCVCGGSEWHMMVDRVLWCRRCGCLRLVFERLWKVPLDQAGALPSSAIVIDEREEPPTLPGTPEALLKTSSRTDIRAVVGAPSRGLTAPGGFAAPARVTPMPTLPLPDKKSR